MYVNMLENEIKSITESVTKRRKKIHDERIKIDNFSIDPIFDLVKLVFNKLQQQC